MANFSALPNELLVEIWSHVQQPKDIENFALTSKNIRVVASRILLHHRELTRQFSNLEVGGQKSKVSAAGLLKEIVTDPRVALYVKVFTVTKSHVAWESPIFGVNTLMASDPQAGEDRQYLHTPYAQTDMELFEQMLNRVECNNDPGRVWVFLQALKSGDETPIIAIMVLLLTNLKSLLVKETEMGFISRLKLVFQGLSSGKEKREPDFCCASGWLVSFRRGLRESRGDNLYFHYHRRAGVPRRTAI